MKAIVYKKYGPPEVARLEDVEKPFPKDDEILIRVFATTVNRTDCGFRKPEYPLIIKLMNGFNKPKRTILGTEFSGEVEAVGKNVSEFKKGDPVFGLTGTSFGAHAEYLCLPENTSVSLKPVNLTHNEAASLCDGAMLAFAYFKKFSFQKEQNILINGASGSIGTAAVQFAKIFGLKITAVCNAKGIETVKSLGADRIIDYSKEDFTQDSEKYDFIFDAVGMSSFSQCKNLLKKNGYYFSTELGFLAQNIFLSVLTKFAGKKKVIFPMPQNSKKDVSYFKELVETGKYKPVIDKIYPFEQIVEAYKYVETKQKIGNVVLTLNIH